jgi:hypothetical protein
MLFYIKELIAAAEDPDYIQNPFVMTKLDLATLIEFDFDACQVKLKKPKTIKLESEVNDVRDDAKDEEDDDPNLRVV